MKTYLVSIGLGLYLYTIKAESLKIAKTKARKLLIYKHEKINWVSSL